MRLSATSVARTSVPIYLIAKKDALNLEYDIFRREAQQILLLFPPLFAVFRLASQAAGFA